MNQTLETLTYEEVIEQVKTLPESLLTSLSTYIVSLKEVSDLGSTPSQNKAPFLELAGKIHLDANFVTTNREESLL